MNILMTCASGGIIINDIKDLKQNFPNSKVFAVDQNPKKNLVKHCDKFIKVPNGDSKNYINKILKLCKAHNISIIIPRSDEEAISLSKNKKKLEKIGIKIPINHFSKLKVLNDKIQTYKKLNKFLNFKLRWEVIKNYKEIYKIKNFLIKNKYCVIKPSVSRGGRNIFHLSNNSTHAKQRRETITDYQTFKKKYLVKLKKNYPLILMEKLNDPVYDLDLLGNKGKYVFHVLRRRVDPRDPNSGHLIEKKILWSKCKKLAKNANRNFSSRWFI